MKQVILRVDDVGAYTDADILRRLYAPCWERARGIPVCFSVIPRAAVRFTASGPAPAAPRPLYENPALCELLLALHGEGLVEAALHGWEHREGELANAPAAAIIEQLEKGQALLNDALPGVPVRVLVPPHDQLSEAGAAAAQHLGLEICSTWAATHGGTRAAHWMGRLRRGLGLPFGRHRKGLWPTDVALPDFDRSTARELPRTRRLLGAAAHLGTPLVGVHHYWQLLDAAGRPNARHLRWVSWLDSVLTWRGVTFARYSG